MDSYYTGKYIDECVVNYDDREALLVNFLRDGLTRSLHERGRATGTHPLNTPPISPVLICFGLTFVAF